MMNAFVIVALSSIFFGVVRFLLTRLSLMPFAVLNSGRSDVAWRWYNVSVSWFHAVLMGLGSLYCLMKDPNMIYDLDHGEQGFATTLVAATTGYFFYDALDILMFGPAGQSMALLSHHAVVIGCFSVVIKTGTYVYFAVLALLVEVNSVFLHMRQLLRISKQHQNTFYTTNMFANILTFFFFRFVTLSWLVYWIWANQDSIDQPYFAVLVFSMPTMYLINIGLFVQILIKDVPHLMSILKTSNMKSVDLWTKMTNTNGQPCRNGHPSNDRSLDSVPR